MDHTEKPESTGPVTNRRRLLLGLGAAGGMLAARPALAQDNSGQVADAPTSDLTQQAQSFLGVHQSGIVTPRPTSGMIATFDVLARNTKDLERLFRTLTERIQFLMTGGEVPELDPKLPPSDSGILGPVVAPDNLTITVALGASLFDDRFGLAAVKPAHLTRMTAFHNDALDADLCHGDLSLQFCANGADTNIHALRDIIKTLPDLLLLRWKQEGSVPSLPVKPGAPHESARNFLGFRDGSANPDSKNESEMNRIVWVGADAGEPEWAVGGSYQVVRIIRNFVERWDRTPLGEQERIFGRRKPTGAPFDGATEADVPNYSADTEGKVTPLNAHIRLANPRTATARNNLILRRPFNYSNGVTKAGQLDQGLLFIAWQADLTEGFIAVQNRLTGEPLEEYIKPVGGGYFFALPGITDAGDFLGRSLFAAAGLSPSNA
ncbi:MAG TPA: iron uptake transporter deferrochelatase/peroxidase subunit [Devosiaceae bacterium]|jgi:deferrochelatase/peroxidase EfeB